MNPWTADDMVSALSALMGGSADSSDPKAALRLRLIDVATDHFVRFGYRRASVGDIAADAGIGKGSLYLHFSNKAALLFACVAREKLSLVPEVQAILALPHAERLERYLQVAFRFCLDAPLTSALAQGDPELRTALSGYVASHAEETARGFDFVASLIDPALGLTEERRLELARTLTASVAMSSHLNDIFLPPGTEPANVAKNLARLLAQGVAAESPR